MSKPDLESLKNRSIGTAPRHLHRCLIVFDELVEWMTAKDGPTVVPSLVCADVRDSIWEIPKLIRRQVNDRIANFKPSMTFLVWVRWPLGGDLEAV